MTSDIDAHGRLIPELRDEVLYLTIDRPAKLNALTPKILAELSQALDDAESIQARAIVIQTSGDRVFCVGADIGIFSALPAEKMRTYWVPMGHKVFDQLANHHLPIFCMIQGLAFGGGLELALACDFRIAASSAKFALPEGKIGTIPGWGGTARLAETIGVARAKQLIMLGEILDAQTAHAWGLITDVAAVHELEATLHQRLEQLNAVSPVSVSLTKQILAQFREPSALIPEAHASEVSAHSAQFAEGIAAFTQKRAPHFSL